MLLLQVAETEPGDGEEQTTPDAEGDGVGITNIVVDVSDKSIEPAQVRTPCTTFF